MRDETQRCTSKLISGRIDLSGEVLQRMVQCGDIDETHDAPLRGARNNNPCRHDAVRGPRDDECSRVTTEILNGAGPLDLERVHMVSAPLPVLALNNKTLVDNGVSLVVNLVQANAGIATDHQVATRNKGRGGAPRR